MFEPTFIITHDLLRQVKRIAEIISQLNAYALSKTVLFKLETNAKSLSAYSSTSIEGNPLPLTEVKRILKNHPTKLRDSEREVLNYNQALETLHQKMQSGSVSPTLSLLCEIQKQVTQGLIPKYQCGKIRQEPVFVFDPKTGKTIYWPPDHQDVSKLLQQLFDFVKKNRERIDPILLAGILHRQLVIIHPFADGNGRCTRLATKILLADLGLNLFPLFSFENYYNQKVSVYFEKVGLRGNYYDLAKSADFTQWLEYFAAGVLDELMRVKKELEKEQASPATALQSHHQSILDHIRQHGYVTDADYARRTERAKATRALDFRKMIDLSWIEKFGKGRLTHYKLKD